jgi:hypothetical protein
MKIINLTHRKASTNNNPTTEGILFKSIEKYIETSNFPKNLQLNKLTLIIDKHKTLKNNINEKMKNISSELKKRDDVINKLKYDNLAQQHKLIKELKFNK